MQGKGKKGMSWLSQESDFFNLCWIKKHILGLTVFINSSVLFAPSHSAVMQRVS